MATVSNNPVVVVRAGVGAIPVVRSGSKTIVAQGGRGQRGASTYSGTAGEAISALRAIRGGSDGLLRYCDAADAADANTCVGVSVTAALKDKALTYQMSGELSDDSWNWNASSAIYVGADGVLTQSPGATFAQIVGYPVAPDKMVIAINQAIKTI